MKTKIYLVVTKKDLMPVSVHKTAAAAHAEAYRLDPYYGTKGGVYKVRLVSPANV